MRRASPILSCVAALAFALFSADAALAERRIALTFDDSPTPDSALMTGAERTARLIDGLAEAGVAQAAFFVVGRNLDASGGAERVKAFAAAGHAIADHSYSHRHLRNADAADYLADIDRAETALAGFDNRRPWFRFPYLDEGGDEARRDAVREGLAARGISNGYVTIDTYDWYLSRLAVVAKEKGECVDEAALGALYVETLVEAAEFYDRVAVKALGRSPAHVMLLHENDLAARHVADLAKGLRAAGWTIVTADEAFADPIAAIEPATVFLGQGRVAAIAHSNGAARDALVHPMEDESVLDALFRERAARPCEGAAQ